MKFRKILLADGSRFARNQVRRMVQSEIGDAIIFEAGDGREAYEKLCQEPFQVVITAKELAHFNGLQLMNMAKNTVHNAETPFLVITSTHTGENVQEMLEQGVRHYLILPFAPLELKAKIDVVCNPRQWRSFPRYSIPGTRVLVLCAGQEVKGEVINISFNGLLCQIPYCPGLNYLDEATEFKISFSPNYCRQTLEGVTGTMNRIQVVASDENRRPKELRMAWQLVELEFEQRDILQRAINNFEKINASW